MVGYFGIFLLVGVSLASNVAALKEVDSEEVMRVVATIEKYKDYVEDCDDVKNVSSCAALAEDVVELQLLVANGTAEATVLYVDGIKLLTKFNTCALKLIVQEIKCFGQVWTSAKTLMTKAKSELATFESDLETLVSKIETNAGSCFGSGFTSEKLEAVLSQCKAKSL